MLPAVTACERVPDNGVVAVIGHLGTGEGEFGYPRAIAFDGGDGVFVVDKTGRVQCFDGEGRLTHGFRMPEVAAGKPVGLTVHPDGRLFIADTHYHRVLITDADGEILDQFGHDGTEPGEFSLPTDVAIDADGFIYVSEYHLTERISKWTPDHEFVALIGDGEIEGMPLRRPSGLVFDDDQTLWVADACNHRLVGFSTDGVVRGVIGEFGSEPGQMRYPYDVNLSPEGHLLVCEYGGNRLQWFDKQGRSVRIWGSAGRAVGQLFAPWGAVYGPGGNVYVVDSQNNRLQVVSP